MDLATIFGLGGAFGLIAMAIVLGGSPTAFIDLSSILIVIGGTFAVTTTCFTLEEIARAQGLILRSFYRQLPDPSRAALRVLQLAERARKEGVLGLQKVLDTLTPQPFLYNAIALVVDGTPGDEVERILRRDVQAMAARHEQSVGVLRRSAEVAPAMGLIGTLVGLVQMLGNLDDPASIGPSMAVALLTTVYGAILANMVFTPLASKLERNSREEVLLNNLYLMAAASIGRQENPRRLEMLLNTLLPPAKRIQYFD